MGNGPSNLSTEDDAVAQAQAIRSVVEYQLRSSYPYMKDKTLEKFLAKVEADCQEFLIAQESEHQQTKSRISFFSLSAELRNKIYELALDRTSSPTHNSSVWDQCHSITSSWHQRRSLLRVSQRVRREVLPMYYAINLRGFIPCSTGNPFTTPPPKGMHKHRVSCYLRVIGQEQAAMIKSFTLVIQPSYYPRSALERLIKDGNLEDNQVVRKLLEYYGLLDLGVPRTSWKLERGNC
ncbi:hypothetical protein HII31_08062 [Pseudocercospora fuligena]|uniref:Uncharacterized protein n=1 Tax=Pseudocercospora fuligena TaxID=685502 RepID=A0A8H6VFY8_9PEZI|nr:hypothetical protein HII31_08062 [Pseudocercospora fuligena]